MRTQMLDASSNPKHGHSLTQSLPVKNHCEDIGSDTNSQSLIGSNLAKKYRIIDFNTLLC